jgi:hypothetical protein
MQNKCVKLRVHSIVSTMPHHFPLMYNGGVEVKFHTFSSLEIEDGERHFIAK